MTDNVSNLGATNAGADEMLGWLREMTVHAPDPAGRRTANTALGRWHASVREPSFDEVLGWLREMEDFAPDPAGRKTAEDALAKFGDDKKIFG